ncbi:hypothetical protein BH09PSE4_BH09PSE4_14610 [soil metagenome]
MFLAKKWVVRLQQPMIVGTSFHGIDRQEVIDTLTLQYLPGGSEAEPAERVVEIWKAIDWDRSDEMLMEEFEACDLQGAVHRAHADARSRAETYCDYMADCARRGIDGSHGKARADSYRGQLDTGSNLRLVETEIGA